MTFCWTQTDGRYCRIIRLYKVPRAGTVIANRRVSAWKAQHTWSIRGMLQSYASTQTCWRHRLFHRVIQPQTRPTLPYSGTFALHHKKHRHSMTVKQPTGSEGVWVLSAAVTAAASATTLYPSLWLPVVAVAAAALVLAGLVRAILSSISGSSSKASSTQVLDLVKSRRSVYPKDFTGNSSGVTQQQLEIMLEAARWAPTHKLTEPWQFVVLSGNSKAEFEDLTIRCCQELLPAEKAEQVVAKLKRKQSKDWPKVHCYIAICMKRHEEVPEWEEIAAVSCAVQNLSLVAHSLGVSGYWSSWQAAARDSAAMHKFLGLDSSRGDRCLGVWLVGQADEARVQGYRPKRQDIAQKVVWKN